IEDIGTKVFIDGDPNSTEKGPRNRFNIRYKQVHLHKAELTPNNKFVSKDRRIFPAECRERHWSYRGRLRASLEFQINDGDWKQFDRELGNMPIMLRTNKCHLQNMTPSQLVSKKEE